MGDRPAYHHQTRALRRKKQRGRERKNRRREDYIHPGHSVKGQQVQAPAVGEPPGSWVFKYATFIPQVVFWDVVGKLCQ